MANVSDRDRAHFARIAKAKEAERETRLDEALARPSIERILEGLELGYAAATDLEEEGHAERGEDGAAMLRDHVAQLVERIHQSASQSAAGPAGTARAPALEARSGAPIAPPSTPGPRPMAAARSVGCYGVRTWPRGRRGPRHGSEGTYA